MPWCNEKLDATLEMVLTKMNIKKGTFLNLGTGWNISNLTF